MKDLINQYRDVQLATLVDRPPEGEDWLHEIKVDGYRLLAFLEEGQVRLFTRNHNEWTDRFPSIYRSVSRLDCRAAILDMEAVIVEPSGRTNFHDLQNAVGDPHARGAIVGCTFDLLHLNGEDLRGLSQTVRKEMLETLLRRSKTDKHLRYSEHIAGGGPAMLKKVCSLGLEGVVSKLASAPYRPGRQKTWLKSKCLARQEFIIIGFSVAKSGHHAIGALYLGYVEDGKVRYAGKVGTGFTMADAKAIFEKLSALEVKTPSAEGVPRAELRAIHWVRPELLCEVAFVEWPPDGHIRHPSFQGLRGDKQARTVKREKPAPVEATADSARAQSKAKRNALLERKSRNQE